MVLAVENKNGKGYSNNIVNALNYFIEVKKYSHIILMDGDLEHDPKDLPRFIKRQKTAHFNRKKKQKIAGQKTLEFWPPFY